MYSHGIAGLQFISDFVMDLKLMCLSGVSCPVQAGAPGSALKILPTSPCTLLLEVSGCSMVLRPLEISKRRCVRHCVVAHNKQVYMSSADSYIPNVDNDKEATDEKMQRHFLVCQNYKNWVAREERICASTKTCPECERGATGLSIIFSHVTSDCCELGTKSCTLRRGCEPVA